MNTLYALPSMPSGHYNSNKDSGLPLFDESEDEENVSRLLDNHYSTKIKKLEDRVAKVEAYCKQMFEVVATIAQKNQVPYIFYS